MEVILLILVGVLCVAFTYFAFKHVSTHEKIDATGIKSLYKRKKNKK
jgi:hypothetical protein